MGLLGDNPCSLLNSTGYPTLWISTSTEVSTLTSANGTLKGFVATLPAALIQKTLASPNATSSARLLQFMSGGGVAAAFASSTNFAQLGNIVLKVSNATKSIVDDYIAPKSSGTYTFSTNAAPKISDANITQARNDLISAGLLLNTSDLFNLSQFTSGTTPSSNESLIYLYKLAQEEQPGLTATQVTRKNSLEAKNLQFFGAFLAEYCFYSSRYARFLKEYFDAYTTPSAQWSTDKAKLNLIAGVGTTDALAASATQPTQPDYLRVVAYHLATLNTRLTDMRRLLTNINQYYSQAFNEIASQIQNSSLVGSDGQLERTINALKDSNTSTVKYLDEAEFRKQVMEYTAQKNRYATMMLSLYAFLNIAALAAIYQVARG